MKIDIQPHVIAPPEQRFALALEVYEKPMYAVQLNNGNIFTVAWHFEEMEAFQPNRTVSEMMAIWEEGNQRQVDVWQKAVDTATHPTWTRSLVEENGERTYGHPYPLDESSVRSANRHLDQLKTQLGELTFVKFSLNPAEYNERPDQTPPLKLAAFDQFIGTAITINGKPATPSDLREAGITEKQIIKESLKNPKTYAYLQTGLVMQWYDGAWHGIFVIVKSNERFIWLKSWDDIKDETKTSKRVLKRKAAQEGYSLMPCGYGSHKIGSRYIGKVLDLSKDLPEK